MSKMGDYSVMDLNPEDMPQFLNDLANKYFEDDFDIRMQLSQCATYIKVFNMYMKKPDKGGSRKE